MRELISNSVIRSSVKESIDVLAPKEWMKGWERRYSKEGELRDDKLLNFFPHITVQRLATLLERRNEQLWALELGCGSGKDSCYLASLGHSVEGIDALPQAIEIARRRSRLMGVEEFVRFSVGDILNKKIPEEKYDIIMAIQTLQYLFDHAIDRLRQIKRGIKPGGYLIYSGNIPPHFETDPPIRFITKEEILEELDGWIIHGIGTEENRLKEGDIRGFLHVLAEKPKE